MDVSAKIRKMISEVKDSKEILKAATLDGMTPLRQATIRKLGGGYRCAPRRPRFRSFAACC
jgi:hypothetical protein